MHKLLVSLLFCLPIAAMTPKTLNKTVKVWQHKLHLDGWTVIASLNDTADSLPDAMAWSFTFPEHQVIVMGVMSNAAYHDAGWENEAAIERDQVDSVIHELMHTLVKVSYKDLTHREQERFVREATEGIMLAVPGRVDYQPPKPEVEEVSMMDQIRHMVESMGGTVTAVEHEPAKNQPEEENTVEVPE